MQDSPSTPQSGWRSWLKTMAGPAVIFYTLPWLMILLTIGTIAQKDIGLFRAHEIFFSSWILWVGVLPLPGTYAVISLITLCLLVKFVFYSEWSWQKSGTILTHLGVLVLLIGGGLTAMTQKEGFIVIRESGQKNMVSDYHARILRIEKNGDIFQELDFNHLSKGRIDAGLPFNFYIVQMCENCRPAPAVKTDGRKEFAEQVLLISEPPAMEAETNLSGVTFKITGADDEQDGTYIIMEEIPHTPEISVGDDLYKFSMLRAQTELPFTIGLSKFTRTLYPGTNMPSAFSSDVEIIENGSSWTSRISMNEPLRHKGYTLYQASFSIRPDGQYSVLSVVENKGRIFPYIASAIIFAGLLLQLIIRLGPRTRNAA